MFVILLKSYENRQQGRFERGEMLKKAFRSANAAYRYATQYLEQMGDEYEEKHGLDVRVSKKGTMLVADAGPNDVLWTAEIEMLDIED